MRQKRSLSQNNTPAADRKLNTETQVDVNEIERELLSRDHNLPGTSTDCFAQPQPVTSKAQERRLKLRTGQLARKRKAVARRRPVSCDSALPRKRQLSRKNSRHQSKPTVPSKNGQHSLYVDDVIPGPSGTTLVCSFSQSRDDNENAPRYRSPQSGASSSSSSPTPITYYRRKHIKRLRSRKSASTRSNATLIPRKRKVHPLNSRSHSNLIYCPQGSHYCVTPSPGVNSSSSRVSLKNRRSSRESRRSTASGYKTKNRYLPRGRSHRASSSLPSRGSSKGRRSVRKSRGNRVCAISRQSKRSREERTPSTTRRSYSESRSRGSPDGKYPSNCRDNRDVSSTPSIRRSRRSTPSRRKGRRHREESSPPLRTPRRMSTRAKRYHKRRHRSTDTDVVRRKRRRRVDRRRSIRSADSEIDIGGEDRGGNVEEYDDVDEDKAITRRDVEMINPVPQNEPATRRYICRVM